MNKKEYLKSKNVKIYDSIDSLFTKGGTIAEDYILVNNKKIGLSQLKFYYAYNCSGKIIGKVLYTIIDNLFLVINDNGIITRKIKYDSTYSYKFMKRIVKAKNLEEFINKVNNADSPMNFNFYGVLCELS